MNPNAAAFSLILKQREAQAHQGSLPNCLGQQTWPPLPPPQQQYYQPLPPQPFYTPGMMYPPQQSNFGNGIPNSVFRPPLPPAQILAQPSQPYMAPQYQNYFAHMQQPHQPNAPTQYQPQHQNSQQSFVNNSIGYVHTNNLGSQVGSSNQRTGKYGPSSAKVKPPPVVDEVGQWYCEPCDKEFTQRSAYETHTATHEKCRHPGCSFSATKKVVMAHFHGAHGQFSGTGYKVIDVEGQKFRVLMGQSPEEIAQWRAERRKKFPTSALEEEKHKQQEALIAAGGLVPAKPVSKLGKKRTQSGISNNGSTSPALKVQKTEEGSEGGDPSGASVLENSGEAGEEGEHEEVLTGQAKRRCIHWGRGRCKAGDKCTFSHDFEPKLCDFFLRGHCKNGFKCFNKHDSAARNEYRAINGVSGKSTAKSTDPLSSSKDSSNKKSTRNANGELSIPEPLAGGERGTLWRKLLEDEIDKEENLILQCLRFLVQNNFLQEQDLPTASAVVDLALVNEIGVPAVPEVLFLGETSRSAQLTEQADNVINAQPQFD